MTTTIDASPLDPAYDPDIDRRTRAFLRDLNKDSSPFWELPGDQSRNIVALQERTPVDLSGITATEQRIDAGGSRISLYVVRPEGVTGILPVFLFFHGAVWIAGNFANHKRLVRDLVVGSRAAGVFVEYTPVPEVHYPVQLNEAYDAVVWASMHGNDIGVDGSRLAVSGNSVGGNMAAALTLMAHHNGGLNIVYQQLCGLGWTPTSTPPRFRPRRTTCCATRAKPAHAKLDEAGVDVTCVRYNGAIHDFDLLNALRDVPSTEAALNQAAADLVRRLCGHSG